MSQDPKPISPCVLSGVPPPPPTSGGEPAAPEMGSSSVDGDCGFRDVCTLEGVFIKH